MESLWKPSNEAGWGSPDTWAAMCRERVHYFYISCNRLDLMPAFNMLWPSLLVVDDFTLFWDIAKLLSAWCNYRPQTKFAKVMFSQVSVCPGTGLGLCIGGLYPWGLCPGGLCPGGLCPGGSLSGWSLSRGSLSGGYLSWGSLSGGISVWGEGVSV